jgi:hypothetical protein
VARALDAAHGLTARATAAQGFKEAGFAIAAHGLSAAGFASAALAVAAQGLRTAQGFSAAVGDLAQPSAATARSRVGRQGLATTRVGAAELRASAFGASQPAVSASPTIAGARATGSKRRLLRACMPRTSCRMAVRRSYAPAGSNLKAGFDLKRNLKALSAAKLRRILASGEDVLACEAVLARSGDNVVSELLRGQRAFLEWEHCPPDDVFDTDSGAQFYYHAHPQPERPKEHGHFHTFLRPRGMPKGIRPLRAPGLRPARGNAALAHLTAIAMDRRGRAIELFATNRWVTDETWYRAPDVVRMLDRFAVDHAQPSWPVNRWITGMIALFEPQIAALLVQRDAVVAAFAPARGISVYENRALEVTGTLRIDVAAQLKAVRFALRGR